MFWLKFIAEIFLYFFIVYWFLFFVLSFIERKKSFISTRYVYKYNLYSFFRNMLLQAVWDNVHINKKAFKYKGIVIYEGNQGNGKTISLVHDVLSILHEYPNALLVDNLGINAEGIHQIPLEHWKQLLDIKNGEDGVISVIDETQLWFSNKDSKNFDPAALGIICQNRKNRRVILGTTQKFYLLAKDIRCQTTLVKSCFTIGGLISGYIIKEPFLDTSGEIKRVKFRGIKIFIQSNELREAYDTYKVIERISSSGFVSPDKNILRK